ncbi:MAG: DNA (cytosine-5-)-methyltransferase [Bacilli bacterium]|nr:DNA (cytosine-5-)-methyltransferase [Bacilli bacterium]
MSLLDMKVSNGVLDKPPRIEINNKIRLIELFSGVGSQAMALKRLNVPFEHYKSIDFDKHAVIAYNSIHNTNFSPINIKKVNGADLEIVDTDEYTYIMTYSFPCVDLTLSGKQKGMAKNSNTRSGLLWEVERILKEVDNLPQILLMENVTQVHGKNNLNAFNEWTSFLESLGYKNYVEDLNAKNFNVPQNRNRTFMVSILGDYSYEFPKPIPLKKTVCDYLEDIEPNEENLKKARELVIPINDTMVGIKQETIKGYIECYIGGVTDLAYPTSLTRNGRVLSNGFLCPTIQHNTPLEIFKVLNVNGDIRRLTPKESWRLMDFTDEDFEKAKEVLSETQLYKKAGNSIVVCILSAIFSQLNIKDCVSWNDMIKEKNK